MQAVFLDYDTVSNGDLDRSVFTRATGLVEFFGTTDPAQITERIRDADIVMLNKVKLARAQLQEARKLKLIAVAGTGTDNVDLAAAQERGIAVCNVRGYCTRIGGATRMGDDFEPHPAFAAVRAPDHERIVGQERGVDPVCAPHSRAVRLHAGSGGMGRIGARGRQDCGRVWDARDHRQPTRRGRRGPDEWILRGCWRRPTWSRCIAP